MHYWHLGHGQMVDFCYDPENLRYGRPDPAIEAIKDQFVAKQLRNGSDAMDYMFFTPKTEEGKTYPLVIYLHGAGERGSDPRIALANSGGTTFASPAWQAEHPCFVMAPQVAENGFWTQDAYIELIAKAAMTLPMEAPIDANRIYITGLSMGGMGTWKAISKYPQLFAAAMPICGAGDPFAVRNAVDVPVWAFHAADDPVVKAYGYQENALLSKTVGSRWLVNSLRGAGNRNVRYTEYPAGYMASLGLGGHASWIPAYADQQAKEWLFSFSRKDRYEIHWVQPGFYWIEDSTGASLYLIEGKDRALVVDTGWCDNDFIGLIRSLTNLPFDLAVTHCHGDHMYHLDKFDRYYMSEKDLFMLDEPFMKGMLGGRDFSKAQLLPVKDGDLIDLGGGVEIEVFDLGGHTPGSVVFLDRSRKIALVGDALGVWMQVPGATDISTYRAELTHFLDRMSAPEYEGVVMMSGHRYQEGGRAPYGEQYLPNDLQKVKDMITLCDLVLNEEVPFEPYFRSFDEPAYVATYGQATLVFTPSRVK
jgi:glyoxylase-like metal-dependent hydrolase (beta-lactamase superfamily II)/dienelactone hydrolase